MQVCGHYPDIDTYTTIRPIRERHDPGQGIVILRHHHDIDSNISRWAGLYKKTEQEIPLTRMIQPLDSS